MIYRRRRAGVMLGAALLGVAAPSPATAQLAPPASPSEPTIQSQLDAWYRRASQTAPGTWGIAVARQDGQLIWAMNPTTPLIPASTVKVFTTGYARTMVGPEARRATRLVGQGEVDPNTGAWLGSWALEVNGDFTLDRPGRTGPTLLELARQLADRGVRSLTGPLTVISESGDPMPAFPSAWASRHRGRLFAPLVGAMTINENTVTLRIQPGTAAGRQPVIVQESPLGAAWLVTNQARTVAGRTSSLSLRAAPNGRWILGGTIGTRAGTRSLSAVASASHSLLEAAWRHALHESGVDWEPSPAVGAPIQEAVRQILAEVSSLPYDSIAAEVNSRSSNLGAELLLRWAAGSDPRLAAQRLTEHVHQVTGDEAGVRLVDGSGLSEDDRASAWSFVAYLSRFPFLAGGRNFPSLLPANGSGTLRTLASGLPAPGVLRAKTGTLGNVASVTGYLGHRDGVLVISMLYNGSRTTAARSAQWQLFRLLGANGTLVPIDAVIMSDEQMGGTGLVPPELVPRLP